MELSDAPEKNPQWPEIDPGTLRLINIIGYSKIAIKAFWFSTYPVENLRSHSAVQMKTTESPGYDKP
jgi:hypothetical protein